MYNYKLSYDLSCASTATSLGKEILNCQTQRIEQISIVRRSTAKFELSFTGLYTRNPSDFNKVYRGRLQA